MDFIPQLSLPVWAEAIIYIGAIAIAYIIGKFREKKKRIRNDKYNAEINWEVHSQIHEFLTELRVKSHAGRAQVIQFHNGEYYMDGISMRKFSVSHESGYKGYYPQVLKFKNSLCSLFTVLLTVIMENKPLIHSVESLSDHGHTKHFFEDEFISHFAALPLKNKGIVVGFILVQWHKDYPPTLDQEEGFIALFEDIHNSIQIDLARQKN
jgi:hypothetical protein